MFELCRSTYTWIFFSNSKYCDTTLSVLDWIPGCRTKDTQIERVDYKLCANFRWCEVSVSLTPANSIKIQSRFKGERALRWAWVVWEDLSEEVLIEHSAGWRWELARQLLGWDVVLDRGSERQRERCEGGEQIQGGAFQSSRSPTARHGWFCGGIFREAGWNHMSQNRLAFQAFHLCFVTLRHFIGFLSHRWPKERNVFERVRRRKHLETHRNSWEFKSSSLWGASGGAGEALSYVLSLTDQTLPQRLSPLNFHIVFSFFFFAVNIKSFSFIVFVFLI